MTQIRAVHDWLPEGALEDGAILPARAAMSRKKLSPSAK